MATTAVGLQTHIWNNNMKSVFLLAGFPFLLLLMFWAFHYFVGISDPLHKDRAVDYAIDMTSQTWQIPLLIAGGWFIIAFFFHQKMIEKASNSKSVTRKEQPELYNMLENLCISRGIPMPKLAVVDSPSLNAFASGLSNKSYTVTVTQGLLDKLDERETKAVIAHELTHIINKDVRLLIISVIFVGMISFFAQMAFRSMIYGRGGRRNGKGSGGAMLIAAIVLAVGYVFAILIRFALSRKREYLADAGSVELTKDPDSMISALEKISGRSKVEGMTDEVSQMCIDNSSAFLGFFTTHPPIPKRIAAIRKFG